MHIKLPSSLSCTCAFLASLRTSTSLRPEATGRPGACAALPGWLLTQVPMRPMSGPSAGSPVQVGSQSEHRCRSQLTSAYTTLLGTASTMHPMQHASWQSAFYMHMRIFSWFFGTKATSCLAVGHYPMVRISTCFAALPAASLGGNARGPVGQQDAGPCRSPPGLHAAMEAALCVAARHKVPACACP